MKRVYVLNHMEMSINGKCTGKFLYTEEAKKPAEIYFEKQNDYISKGFSGICMGKNTWEEMFTHGYKPDLSKYKNTDIKFEDFDAKTGAKKYIICFDRKASLGWKSPLTPKWEESEGFENLHVIEVLTEKANKEMVAYYKDIGISYIFAGKEDMDINLALEKLKTVFGMEKIVFEGGPTLNASFIKADCIDELSLVLFSETGETDAKSIYPESVLKKFKLKKCEVFTEGNAVWLNYQKV